MRGMLRLRPVRIFIWLGLRPVDKRQRCQVVRTSLPAYLFIHAPCSRVHCRGTPFLSEEIIPLLAHQSPITGLRGCSQTATCSSLVSSLALPALVSTSNHCQPQVQSLEPVFSRSPSPSPSKTIFVLPSRPSPSPHQILHSNHSPLSTHTTFSFSSISP